jgi:hypothetical protein
MSVILNTNLISKKIDQVIAFVEKNVLNSLGVRIMNKLETVGTSTQQLHQAATHFDTIYHPNKTGPLSSLLSHKAIKTPVGATGLFSLFNIPQHITNIVKSVKTAVETKKSLKKLDASLQVAESATSLVGTVDSVLTAITAINSSIKVSDIAAHIFAGFNIVNASLGLTIKGRSIYKTQKCYNELKQIRRTDYKSLNKFFNDDKNLGILGIDKAEKFKQIANKMVDNTHILNRDEQTKVDALIKDLKGRLKTKQTTHAIGMISDCLNIVNSALIIASVACPPLLIVAATFSVVTTVGLFIHKQITDYKFEQKMGLTETCPKDLQGSEALKWKVGHFFKWNIQGFLHPA